MTLNFIVTLLYLLMYLKFLEENLYSSIWFYIYISMAPIIDLPGTEQEVVVFALFPRVVSALDLFLPLNSFHNSKSVYHVKN